MMQPMARPPKQPNRTLDAVLYTAGTALLILMISVITWQVIQWSIIAIEKLEALP